MSWRQISLKYVARFAYGDALPRTDDGAEGRIQVFGSNGPYATFSQANTRSPAIVIGRKGSYGKVNWTKEACFASDTTFFVDETTTQQYLRWLFYVFQTLNLDKGTDEAAVPGLNRDDAYERKIFVPPLPEQRAIADYLDRETAKIDALIAEKEHLLSLLAEKRRTLITQAVTRGLNPDVPMRDSGVEWLGEIPRHWEISRLKMLGQIRTGITKGRNLGNRETVTLPYLRVANVQDGYLNLSDVAKIEVLPEEALTYRLEKGDVLMNEGGDADKLGRGTVWSGSLDPCLHQNHVFAVRCFHVESTWLATVIGSDYAKFYFESRSKQSTNLASISSTNIQELPVVMPPQEERLVIVKYLEEQISKLDDLRTIAKRAIELLQERRAALISAAVTGQIRVGVES